MVTTASSVGHKFRVHLSSTKRSGLSDTDRGLLGKSLAIERVEPEQIEVVVEGKDDLKEVVSEQERLQNAIQNFQNVLQAAQEMQKLLAHKLKDYTVRVDPNKDPSVRDAIRRTFGKDSDTVTHDMFRQCLEWRSQMIKEQRQKAYGGL